MHSFHYRDGKLYCEEVDLGRVAQEFGTPLYIYSAGTILDHYQRLDRALGDLDHLICYAVKANSNRAILKLLADAGAGFDIVSGGELFRARAAGGLPDRCTFAGVGKSREEIEYALEQGVYSLNVESEAELDYINQIAGAKNLRAPIALRLNPDVDPHTHEYISTGSHENKFGIALEHAAAVYERAATMSNIRIVGVQMHIGSQITETEPFAEAIRKVSPLVSRVEIETWDRIFQHRRRARHRLRIVVRERERRLVAGEQDCAVDPAIRRCDFAGAARAEIENPARARPAARGQRRSFAHACPLPQAKRPEEIRDCRCGNERPDPARALPRLSRDRSGR